MAFTVQQMLGSKALVSGTDLTGAAGSTVVDTTQWDELTARKNFSARIEDFDKAVREFFKPLTEAAEAVTDSVPEQDPMEYIVLTEGVEGVEAEPAQVVELSHDSMILRFIEQNDTDRLIWLPSGDLGILAKS